MQSRRAFLGGAMASVAGLPAVASPPEVSLRPLVRPGDLFQQTVPSVADLVSEANLGGEVGFAVADAATGQMLEVHNPLRGMPPASVAKAITCAYALDRLGPGHRFRTRLEADGEIIDGRLDGDLWLIGSGDPLFNTDALAAMAADLRELGLREVTGRLMVADGALPNLFEIDASQPDHVGYNPAISGLNLNFNRVHFEWQRNGTDYNVTLDARSATLRPPVRTARMEVAERRAPIYTYSQIEGRDHWTVARGALGNSGARWLPVRKPTEYLVEVFQSLTRSNGLILNEVTYSNAVPPDGLVIVEHVSPPLDDMLRGMMRWSTNLTAEVVGLSATQAGGVQPESLSHSASEMNAWMRDRLGARQARFVDHSGLGDQSRVRPQDMTQALVSSGANGLLRRLMRDIPMRDASGAPMADHPIKVVAKTGTLNFVSTLAGYATTPGGRHLAFTVFCGDIERRAALTEAERERPPGARTYNRRAKRLQQALIERWSALYGAV
ncbi:MAG: D-alanyl-D-alanine carboxypeptidase/D-alanyl-D-alanine-endopeptidase [Pseudomonadota bacterium]